MPIFDQQLVFNMFEVIFEELTLNLYRYCYHFTFWSLAIIIFFILLQFSVNIFFHFVNFVRILFFPFLIIINFILHLFHNSIFRFPFYFHNIFYFLRQL